MSKQPVRTEAIPGRHDANKARRRTAILDGTLTLLRATPIEKVSIEAIAAEAGVAPATVYNLVGSRDQLLIACVDRVVDSLVDSLIEAPANADPLAAAVTIVEKSCDAFISDGEAFRQIVGAVNGISRAGRSLSVDPAQLQVSAMRAAKEVGLLVDDADPVAMGRQVFLSYNGALFAWAARQLTDEGFRAAALHGLWTVLLASAADEHRTEFSAKVRDVATRMVEAGYGSSEA
ncbi:MAG: TetR/AcrR family transcriptional regulator [Actinomycetota bacterium]|nr:TetR/AcrR family transcriptional regulator [Actinomycetota bacterium]